MPRGAAPQLLTILLWLALTATADMLAHAQVPEKNATRYLPREEMIDTIIHYALLGDCQARRSILGSAFASACNSSDNGDGEPIRMMSFLDRLADDSLIEICRRNKIVDCEKPREASKGRSILTFQSEFEIEFNSPRATWSPDGRMLLLDSLNLPAGEVRVLDVAAGRLLDPLLYAGPPISDAAWSPDGHYIALNERKRVFAARNPALAAVRLYDTATRRELARISAADAGCAAGFAEGMAFTADSKALWLLCSHQTKEAKAVMLKVPGLQVEDSFLPPTPIPGWSESYWEDELQRAADDLILTIRFATQKPAKGPRSAVQAFRLSTRQPLYPPMYVGGGSRLADDLSGLYVGDELWSTQSGQRVAAGVKPSGRYLGAPNRLPGLGMHIEVKAPPGSLHGALAVVDNATGATVQEIGPIPKVVTVLVSPDGRHVAAAGFHGIRFYRVGR
jgi:hypothetical protein